MRLQVFLAKAGIASRRSCEKFITAGRVSVNGKVVKKLGSKVDSGARVTLDGHQVFLANEKRYYAFNKPIGVICSNKDETGRKMAIDFFPPDKAKGIFSVGRLDFFSSGLIFFTNDGQFARLISHPSFEIEKEYQVETIDKIPFKLFRAYKKGIWIEGVYYQLKDFKVQSESKANLILKSGKNREIRRVFRYFKVKLKSLKRIRIGCVGLGNLGVGKFRELTIQEIEWFRKKIKKKEEKNGLDQLSSL